MAPVLLIHGFGQNRYAWHLPSRSFANHLAHAGFDVFNLDLRGHGRSRHMGARRSTGVLDYVTYDLPVAIEEIQRLVGPKPVFLVGHSLGGIVSYAAAPALDVPTLQLAKQTGFSDAQIGGVVLERGPDGRRRALGSRDSAPYEKRF